MKVVKKARKLVETTLRITGTEKYFLCLSNRKAPDFIIIGAMKSGTTSLFHYLRNHSGIISSNLKELYFFSTNYSHGIYSYLKHFPYKMNSQSKLVFEASTTYLHDPITAERIKRVLPNVKLIAILRDPIERAISHYNFNSSESSAFVKENYKSYEKRDIISAFHDDLNGKEKRMIFKYCNLGLYGKQIERYYNLFKRENLLILDFHELEFYPRILLKKISEFLGIDSIEFDSFNANRKKIATVDSDTFNEKKVLNIYNTLDYDIKIPKELERELIEFYREDVKKLLTLTSMDFDWSKKYLVRKHL